MRCLAGGPASGLEICLAGVSASEVAVAETCLEGVLSSVVTGRVATSVKASGQGVVTLPVLEPTENSL